MLALLCFLITISSNSPTDIFEIPEETVPKLHIVSDKNSDRIERIYVQNMVTSDKLTAESLELCYKNRIFEELCGYEQSRYSGDSGDPVCSLPKEKKIALCQQIFEQRFYNNLGIYLNKIAFSIATPTCEANPLRFKTRSDFQDDKVTQKMYPCHGRHDPIRSSFIEDNYYDKYYVSAGPVDNSVMVYVYGYNAIDDWYNIFDYLRNVELSELPDKFVEIAELTEELERNRDHVLTNDIKEIENIFVQEHEYIPNPDPICDLERGKKTALCQFIFNQHYYKNNLGITLNKNAFFVFVPICQEHELAIRYLDSEKHRIILISMFPCFGRNKSVFGNVLQDYYMEYIYVSSGPRKNSLFVYVNKDKKQNRNLGTFYLFNMVENFHVRDLNSVQISLEELETESLLSRTIIKELTKYDKIIRLLKQEILSFLKQKKNLSRKEEIQRLNENIEFLHIKLREMQEKFDAIEARDEVKEMFTKAETVQST